MRIEDRSVRRTLVLAGGGAKGAYAFGALEAFKELGLEFVGVAGTSVGALNAVLWATNSLTEGRRLWDTLSFESVYPLALGRNRSKAYVWARCIFHVVSNLFLATRNGVPHEATSYMRSLYWLIGLVIFCGIPCLFVGQIGLFGLILWVYTLWSHRSALMRSLSHLALYTAALFYLGGATWFLWHRLGSFSAHLRSLWNQIPSLPEGPVWDVLSGLTFFVLSIPLMFIVPMLVIGPAIYLRKRFQSLSQSKVVFERAPLRETVERLLGERELTIPTWVTTGVLEAQSFDPVERSVVQAWRARYSQLQQKERRVRADFCIASAALPFGLTEPIKIGNELHVDGGVIDNCPVVPFLREHDIDECFVVLLTPYRSNEEAIRSILGSYSAGVLKATARPKIVPIFPSESLGGFITGTLNFTPSYAQNARESGLRETRARFGSA